MQCWTQTNVNTDGCCPAQCNDAMDILTHLGATQMTKQSQWTSTPQYSLGCPAPTATMISSATWNKDCALDVKRKDTKRASAQTERNSLSRQIHIARKGPLAPHPIDHRSSNVPIRQSAHKALESPTNPRQGILMHASHP